MNNILLTPPICFIVVLLITTIFAWALSKLSFKPKDRPADAGTSYACGENIETNLMQPDYSQFFPFAFFFTVLHVVALTIATIPVETTNSFAIALIYLIGAMIGLIILLRR
jgi:NADH-quinone oxidoreductase subunit A